MVRPCHGGMREYIEQFTVFGEMLKGLNKLTFPFLSDMLMCKEKRTKG